MSDFEEWLKGFEWAEISTAPKCGREFLVCFPNMMNTTLLVSWHRVHKCFRNKGEVLFLHEGDLWCDIPARPDWRLNPCRKT